MMLGEHHRLRCLLHKGQGSQTLWEPGERTWSVERSFVPDPLVETAGAPRGIDAELGTEQPGAALKLLQRLDALAGQGIGAHQLTVQTLTHRLQRYRLLERRNGSPVLAASQQAVA